VKDWTETTKDLLDNIYENRLMMKNHLGNEDDKGQLDKVFKELGDVWEASRHASGCWVVQKLFQICCKEDVTRMLDQFEGRIWEGLEHLHANHVLLAMCDWSEARRLIIREVDTTPRPQSADSHDPKKEQLYLATHRFGCRILPRILDHDGKTDYVKAFIEKVLHQSQESRTQNQNISEHANYDLCSSKYGHHVARSILEKGAPEHQHKIVEMLKDKLMDMAKNRHATYVIEDVLEYGELTDKEDVINELIKKENIMQLAKNQFGSFVVSNLAQLKHDEADSKEDVEMMNQAEREEDMKNAQLMKKAKQAVKTVLEQNKEQLTSGPESECKHARKLFEEIF